MNTCKTALRILKSRKMYLVIYLGFIGIMMFAISWQIMRGSTTSGDEVFHPDTARVAVIDRDSDADGISSALRSYLALDGEMVDLADDSEALQQAGRFELCRFDRNCAVRLRFGLSEISGWFVK